MAHSDETSAQARGAVHDMYSVDDVPGDDRVYHIKARLLNNAIQQMGMGKYQVSP